MRTGKWSTSSAPGSRTTSVDRRVPEELLECLGAEAFRRADQRDVVETGAVHHDRSTGRNAARTDAEFRLSNATAPAEAATEAVSATVNATEVARVGRADRTMTAMPRIAAARATVSEPEPGLPSTSSKRKAASRNGDCVFPSAAVRPASSTCEEATISREVMSARDVRAGQPRDA